jgi:hypothetical protein
MLFSIKLNPNTPFTMSITTINTTTHTHNRIGKAYAIQHDNEIYLLTNFHVIKDYTKITSDGTPVRCIYKNPRHDLALLSCPTKLDTFSLSDTNGSVIVGLHRIASTDIYPVMVNSNAFKVLSIPVQINPGDSGSPVCINTHSAIGSVVGRNSDRSYIIMSKTIQDFLQQFSMQAKHLCMPKCKISLGISNFSKLDIPSDIQF